MPISLESTLKYNLCLLELSKSFWASTVAKPKRALSKWLLSQWVCMPFFVMHIYWHFWHSKAVSSILMPSTGEHGYVGGVTLVLGQMSNISIISSISWGLIVTLCWLLWCEIIWEGGWANWQVKQIKIFSLELYIMLDACKRSLLWSAIKNSVRIS